MLGQTVPHRGTVHLVHDMHVTQLYSVVSLHYQTLSTGSGDETTVWFVLDL